MQSGTPQESERHMTDLWGNISCCFGANGFAIFWAVDVGQFPLKSRLPSVLQFEIDRDRQRLKHLAVLALLVGG
jgi:hypothetical protein